MKRAQRHARYAAALIAATALPASIQAAEVHVKVRGAASYAGKIQAAICTREEFSGLHCRRSTSAPVANHEARLAFDVPPGRYAIAVFHDRYADGRIHRSFLGLPRQGVGFSRNPLLLGAPSFARTAIDVPADGSSIDIQLVFEPRS